MKHLLIIILLGMSIYTKAQRKSGELKADSTRAFNDTTKGVGVYLKGNTEVKVDSNIILVRRSAPMIFKGTDGTTAETDKLGALWVKYYLKGKEIPVDDILYFKPKK